MRKRSRSILEALPDELIVDIISEWVGHLRSLLSLDAAICNKILRMQFVNCLSTSVLSYVHLRLSSKPQLLGVGAWIKARRISLFHISIYFPVKIKSFTNTIPPTSLRSLTIDLSSDYQNISHAISIDDLLLQLPQLLSLTLMGHETRRLTLKLKTIAAISASPPLKLQSLHLASVSWKQASDAKIFFLWLGNHVCSSLSSLHLTHCTHLTDSILYSFLATCTNSLTRLYLDDISFSTTNYNYYHNDTTAINTNTNKPSNTSLQYLTISNLHTDNAMLSVFFHVMQGEGEGVASLQCLTFTACTLLSLDLDMHLQHWLLQEHHRLQLPLPSISNITMPMMAIRPWQSLHTLQFYDSEWMDDLFVLFLTCFGKQLQSLEFVNCVNLTDIVCIALVNVCPIHLLSLHIINCKLITNESIYALCRCLTLHSSLQEIIIKSCCNLTNIVYEQLLKMFPLLHTICLDINPLSDGEINVYVTTMFVGEKLANYQSAGSTDEQEGNPLKHLEFSGKDHERIIFLGDLFHSWEFQFPRLETIYLSYVPLTSALIERILIHCPRVHTMQLYYVMMASFIDNVTWSKGKELKLLDIGYANVDVKLSKVQKVLNECTRLQELYLPYRNEFQPLIDKYFYRVQIVLMKS